VENATRLPFHTKSAKKKESVGLIFKEWIPRTPVKTKTALLAKGRFL
jgi:hypothetical protein